MFLRTLLHDRYAVLRDLAPITVKKFDFTIDRFRDFLRDTSPGRDPEPTLADLEDLVVMRFLRWRGEHVHHGRKPSPETLRKDRACLLALSTFAARKRMEATAGEGPVQFLELKSRPPALKIPVAYTSDEISRLVVLARQREGDVGGQPAGWFWSTLIQTAFATGERIGALLALRWGQVDLDARVMTFLAETRKGRARDIQRAIPAELAEEMRPRLQGDADLVWDWCRDRNQYSLWPSLRLLCRRAGIKVTGFHALRKASASYMAAAGGNAAAQEHLGHASPATTRDHYFDPRITGRQSGLEFLPKLDLGAGPNLSKAPPPAG